MAANNVQAQLKKVQDKVNVYLHDETTPLGVYAAKAEAMTKIPRDRLAAGAVGVTLLFLIVGYGAQLLCNLIGFVYPAYASLKALETHQADDDKKWLTYWVVFSFFSVVEFFGDIIFSWIPFYWLVKCVLLVWLMVPGSYNGSLTLYERIIRPFFLKNASKVDKILNAAENVARGAAREAREVINDKSE